MTGFSTLNTALTGLAASQRALDISSQNIVNANTPGYSRQSVELESMGPVVTATAQSGSGESYGGVRVSDVSRIHDTFIEATRAAAGGKQANINAELDVLSNAQTLLNEPSDSGLQSSLDSFYSAWQDLSNNPTDTAAGSVVLQRGSAVASQLKTVSDGISAQWNTAASNLTEVVSEANQAASDLAKLNGSIQEATNSGQPVNELLDTRDTLVRKLSTLVGASAVQESDGRVSVSVNGINLVSGNDAEQLSFTGAQNLTSAASTPPTLSVGQYTVPVDSGQAAGLLAAMGTDLPALSAKVDGVANALITAVNDVYSTGYASDGTTGSNFFSGTDAQSIAVVPTDTTQLAVASSAGTVDGTIAGKIGDLSDDATAASTLGTDGPSAQWRTLTSGIGVQVQSLTTAQTVQNSVVSAADTAVTGDSGVNLDEEMTNMMLYQRSYEASARVVTTADSIMDTLINHTGLIT